MKRPVHQLHCANYSIRANYLAFCLLLLAIWTKWHTYTCSSSVANSQSVGLLICFPEQKIAGDYLLNGARKERKIDRVLFIQSIVTGWQRRKQRGGGNGVWASWGKTEDECDGGNKQGWLRERDSVHCLPSPSLPPPSVSSCFLHTESKHVISTVWGDKNGAHNTDYKWEQNQKKSTRVCMRVSTESGWSFSVLFLHDGPQQNTLKQRPESGFT